MWEYLIEARGIAGFCSTYRECGSVERVFVTYRLRSEAQLEPYERFSRDEDQVIVPHQQGIINFEVYVVEESENSNTTDVVGAGQQRRPLDVIEIVDVASWAAFKATLETPPLKKLGQQFAEFADPASVSMLRTRRL